MRRGDTMASRRKRKSLKLARCPANGYKRVIFVVLCMQTCLAVWIVAGNSARAWAGSPTHTMVARTIKSSSIVLCSAIIYCSIVLRIISKCSTSCAHCAVTHFQPSGMMGAGKRRGVPGRDLCPRRALRPAHRLQLSTNKLYNVLQDCI